MKIAEITTFVVANPPPHRGGPYFVFVKLTTDSKIEGIGEVYGTPFHPSKVAQLIEDVSERYVIGWDPFNTGFHETGWRSCHAFAVAFSRRPQQATCVNPSPGGGASAPHPFPASRQSRTSCSVLRRDRVIISCVGRHPYIVVHVHLPGLAFRAENILGAVQKAAALQGSTSVVRPAASGLPSPTGGTPG